MIKDLLKYFRPHHVLDPMTGSGTCADVCRELGIDCVSFDIAEGKDACGMSDELTHGTFDFLWLHPPYWRQKRYTDDRRDLSNCPNLDAFLNHLELLLLNCELVLAPGGKLAVLMGDYSDREAGFVPLTFHTKASAFRIGLKQVCTDIIRFSHGASSGRKRYKSSFIPGLHDVCMIFEKR